MKSITQKTVEHYNKLGFISCSAESYNAFSGRKHDLFGFIDIVVLARKEGILGVQVSSISNHLARKKKILSSASAIWWIQSGARIIIMTWEGDRRKEEEITLQMFVDFSKQKKVSVEKASSSTDSLL